MPKSAAMKPMAVCAVTMLWQLCLVLSLVAQTPPPPPAKSPEMTQLEALAKKMDEQNAKIDALSQQIL